MYPNLASTVLALLLKGEGDIEYYSIIGKLVQFSRSESGPIILAIGKILRCNDVLNHSHDDKVKPLTSCSNDYG
jgi:hypothetical protein